MLRHARPCLAVAATLALATAAAAQCGPQWLPGLGLPGANGAVYASVMWDADGPGPQEARLVIGGGFTVVDDAQVQRLAVLNSTTGKWSAIPGPATGGILALAVLPSGHLVAAGNFSEIGGVTASNIARYDGSQWHALGSGIDDDVLAVVALPDGSVVAAGDFGVAGGVPVGNIAIWNGGSWSGLGEGTNGRVEALAVTPAGHVVAGGSFSGAGLIAGDGVALWNGTAWESLGINQNGWVEAVAAMPDGEIVIGGTFTQVNSQPSPSIARYNGATWSPLGSGLHLTSAVSGTDSVRTIAPLPGGGLIAGGMFNRAGSVVANGVARWDGSAWHPYGDGIGIAFPAGVVLTAQPMAGGDVFVGGGFAFASGLGAKGMARWDGTQWRNFGPGFDRPVGLALMPDGSIVAAGGISTIEHERAASIAQWNGVNWSTMAGGRPDGVGDLLPMPDGTLAVASAVIDTFTVYTVQIWRWDRQAWSPIGPEIGGSYPQVTDMEVLASGDLVLTGAEGLFVRWDGSAWVGFPGPPGLWFDNGILDLLALPDGQLFAGGTIIEKVARWNGAAWWSVGTFNHYARSLAIGPGGHVYAAGDFTQISGVTVPKLARWDGGSIWSAPVGGAPPGTLFWISSVPGDDDLLALTSTSLSRYNGTSWTSRSVAPGTSSAVLHPSGETIVSGDFMIQGGVLSPYFARYTPTNAPWVALQPEAVVAAVGSSATFSATPAVGYNNLLYQWQRETAPGVWANITDGPGGAGPGGGTVINASGPLNGGEAAMMSISAPTGADAGNYRVVISSACGQDESLPATLTLTNPTCRPDLTASCPARLDTARPTAS